MTTVLPPFVDALPSGVKRVSLATPFRVGHVNCYLLADPPVTVIDPGTMLPGSLDQLGALLADHGLRFNEIEQIIVTHAHPDHFGAAAAVAARSGGRIVCGVPEIAGLTGPADPRPATDLLVRLGVPRERLSGLFEPAGLAGLIEWADRGDVVGIEDGATLVAGGRRLEALVTPGHSPGHLSLWDRESRVLLSGDHLLARIIPVTSLGVEETGGCGRRRSLADYLQTLPRFVELDPAVVLPGHGRPFTGMDVLATRLRTHSRQRADDIAGILADGPATPYEVATRLLWRPDGHRLLGGIAHVQGHLDLLEAEGRVVAETSRVTSYRLRP